MNDNERIKFLESENKELRDELAKFERYDYYEVVTEDLTEYLTNCIECYTKLSPEDDKETMRETLRSEASDSDAVTGNMSGSYFCNAYRAKQALCSNGQLVIDAMDEGYFSCDALRDAETLDVMLRFYVCDKVFDEVFDKVYAQHGED